MKDKLLIIGAGGLGRMTLDIAETQYDCFFVDDAFDEGSVICNTKVVGHLSDLPKLKSRFNYFVVAIGDNKLREKITINCREYGLENVSIVSSDAFISKWAKIGRGCIIQHFATVQNGASIGNGTIVSSHSEIHHDSTVGNYCSIYPNSVIRTYAKLGDRVKCGSNVSVSNGVCASDDLDIKNGEVL